MGCRQLKIQDFFQMRNSQFSRSAKPAQATYDYGVLNLQKTMLRIPQSCITPPLTCTYDRLSSRPGAHFAGQPPPGVSTQYSCSHTTALIEPCKGVNIGSEYDVDYGYDTYGRFSTVTNGSDVYTYGYNDRSEVTSADATNDALYNFGFGYDTIGNHKTYGKQCSERL